MPGKLILTVHLVCAAGAAPARVLRAAQRHVHRELGIAHCTVQVEPA